jgi:3-oxoadipate enol-lactonase
VVELGERGTTFVREVPGPPGAPVVVLLHGLTAVADINWFPVFEVLGEAGFRVVSIEYRGYARGPARLPGGWRLDDLADDVVAVADRLGVDRFVPVGYSMGGAVAQLVWRRHRSRVGGLVLCATASVFSATVRERVLSRLLPAASAAGRARPSVAGRYVGSALRARFVGSPLAPWAAAELARHPPATMLAWAAALSRFSSASWIGGVDVATAVVVTSRDLLVPTARQRSLAAAIPGAHVVRLAGDHGVFVTDQAAFAAAVLRACRLVTTA